VSGAAILVAGCGAVGAAAAAALRRGGFSGPLALSDRRARRAAAVAAASDVRGEPVAWRPGQPLPEGTEVLVTALPPGPDVRAVRAGIEAGVSAVTATDDAAALARLCGLDDDARAAGVPVVIGAGMAPGLADVLVRHAADALERVEEVRVARFGEAGRACRQVAQRARGRRAFEWWEGARREVVRRGPELVWFPDPVGERDCVPTTDGARLLHRAFPEARFVGMRRSNPPRRWSRDAPGQLGAVLVEVRGRRGRVPEVLVYGVVGDVARIAGTCLGVLAAALARGDARLVERVPGVAGPAEVVRARAVVATVRDLGVPTFAFDGVPVR
jgi:hypothetical protein